ncbi:MAG TPA: hypothetical protein VN894_07290, partial [Polyangiaceae bacterium]|nr:hypothetical protein [Polyangiaceae bacterium]
MRTRSVTRTLLALLFAVVSSAALAAGCGVDNELVGGTCADGYAQCGLHCVKLAVDPRNCGACGHACQGGSACADGACDSAIDASADAPLVPEGAADGPARNDGSRRADGSLDTPTAEASAIIADDSSGEPETEASWEGASIDPAEAGADDAAADGGTPADPTDSTGATLGEGGDAGDLDSSSLDPTDATGDDSSAVDPNEADSAAI